MALDKTTLTTAILTAFKDQKDKTGDTDEALADLADKLSAAIDTYVKTATVTTTVTGSSVTGGAVTGTGTGTLS